MGLLFYIERLHLTVIADGAATAYHLKCENKSRCCTLDCRKRSYRGGGGVLDPVPWNKTEYQSNVT